VVATLLLLRIEKAAGFCVYTCLLHGDLHLLLTIYTLTADYWQVSICKPRPLSMPYLQRSQLNTSKLTSRLNFVSPTRRCSQGGMLSIMACLYYTRMTQEPAFYTIKLVSSLPVDNILV